MAENKNSNTVPATQEARAAVAAAEREEAQKYVSDAVARRAARFAEPEEYVGPDEIRAQRQALLDSLVPDTLVDEGINGNPQKPVDNPIPVRHNGEEPGEPDYGEDAEDVKIREDVKDFVPQPEGHRVPLEAQLNGETGDGGVMPVESWERQGRVPADGETELAPPVSSNAIDENGNNEVGRLVSEQVANIEGQEKPNKDGENDPAPPQATNVVGQDGSNETGRMLEEALQNDPQIKRDPAGREKGLKELSDGTVIDAEGDKNSTQPEGHSPEPNATKDQPVDEAKELEDAREDYKKAFGKPANARWSTEHLRKLIAEKG